MCNGYNCECYEYTLFMTCTAFYNDFFFFRRFCFFHSTFSSKESHVFWMMELKREIIYSENIQLWFYIQIYIFWCSAHVKQSGLFEIEDFECFVVFFCTWNIRQSKFHRIQIKFYINLEAPITQLMMI